jgi:hypothetical protein
LFDGRQEVSESPDEPIVGKRALVLEAIDPARPGRVELSGTGWTAESNVAIPAGGHGTGRRAEKPDAPRRTVLNAPNITKQTV